MNKYTSSTKSSISSCFIRPFQDNGYSLHVKPKVYLQFVICNLYKVENDNIRAISKKKKKKRVKCWLQSNTDSIFGICNNAIIGILSFRLSHFFPPSLARFLGRQKSLIYRKSLTPMFLAAGGPHIVSFIHKRSSAHLHRRKPLTKQNWTDLTNTLDY